MAAINEVELWESRYNNGVFATIEIEMVKHEDKVVAMIAGIPIWNETIDRAGDGSGAMEDFGRAMARVLAQ